MLSKTVPSEEHRKKRKQKMKKIQPKCIIKLPERKEENLFF